MGMSWEPLQAMLGLGKDVAQVGIVEMALRTVLVYVAALVLVRLASRRLLAKASAFDVIVAIMLGSILSRAINGSAPLLPTLAAGAVLLAMQRLLAVVARHTDWLGPMVKGGPVLLIEDGQVRRQGLREAGLTREDLAQALRLEVRHEDPARVRRAYMERNGKISVIAFPSEPRAVTVKVEQGVQTVRIED
ncbi:MAG TPA: YetF domain-containing protein [Gammaproteobacteria bacterium]|nr:YetF domain-containing protein [Gammaproteobacteria bacterium]